MKFGETFTEYLHGEQEAFLHKCSHVEYKMLKKVLRSCRDCRASADRDQNREASAAAEETGRWSSPQNREFCSCDKDKCKLCDRKFFGELTREASEIAGCFRSRVRRLLHLHVSSGGLQSYIWRLRHCFTDDQQVLIQEGRILLDYVTVNAIAIRKILKKYDKVHGSVHGKVLNIGYRDRIGWRFFISDIGISGDISGNISDIGDISDIGRGIKTIYREDISVISGIFRTVVHGRNFKSEMQAKRIELLQSPWLIELGAFYINFTGTDIGEPGDFFREFSCNLSGTQPVMTMILSISIKYEYNLTCAICLDTVFNPYALSCGHLFCKSCACSAASVLIFQGLKTAPRGAKCPVCRSAGVYGDAVHMQELDLLLKNRCKDYWKERLREERTKMVKQAKEYWESQRLTAMGI